MTFSEDNMASTIAELLDLTRGLPSGVWAAISERQHIVLAYGRDAEAVLSEARSKGEERPLIVRVPDRSRPMFFPSLSLSKP